MKSRVRVQGSVSRLHDSFGKRPRAVQLAASIFARASPSEIGTTQATSDGNFLSSSGSVFGLQLSIPLASRKEEREHAVRALNEVKAVEELRAAVLQDLGVPGSTRPTTRPQSSASHSGATSPAGHSSGSTPATMM